MSPAAKNRSCFAAVGDVHGHMDEMVTRVEAASKAAGRRVDFVLQVGDFEPHRDPHDLASMHAPKKFHQLGTFHRYFNNVKTFPWMIYFIGGNHEPYRFLDQHPRGGLIARNCYYLGRVGAVTLGDLRIAGLSGIFREALFDVPRPGYDRFHETSNRAYTGFTAAEVDALLSLAPVDILLLHDWPDFLLEGSEAAPLRARLRRSRGGNAYASVLVELLRPDLVLCGHMHEAHDHRWSWGGGRETLCCCLDHVMKSDASVALFDLCDGQITPLF